MFNLSFVQEMTIDTHSVANEIHEVIVSPRCLDFEVHRAGIDQFARTKRGKVPVLYQHGISE